MHHSRILSLTSLVVAAFGALLTPAGGQGIIADHTHTDLNVIPPAAITQAKQALHIAYGHTSHGSQVTDGMSGLVAFMNAKPGDAFPDNLFTFNNGGSGGALDYRDFYGNFGGVGIADDLGAPNRTAWDTATRTYLAAHPEVNVIMWSWCGQVDGTQAEIADYLARMTALEAAFPQVRFVYMTGHLNGGGAAGNVNVRNNQIRDYCRTNNKVLFDFADIESYDPDGLVHYMPLYCDDGCNYTLSGQSRNWATEWQAAHTEGTDWYDCGAAHSQPLNANRKAYAAWWLWARLGGWAGPVADSTPPTVPTNLHTTSVTHNRVELAWDAASDAESGVSGYQVYRAGALLAFTVTTSYADTSVGSGATYSYVVRAVNGATLVSGDSNAVSATTPVPTDTEPPSAPGNLTASAVTTSTVHLAWEAATDNVGVTGYRVYRDGALRSSVTGTSFDDSALNPGTTYLYTVTARDAAGNESQPSGEATVQTSDPTDTTAPSVPGGLTVGTLTTTTVQLTWNASTDDNAVAGYRVYRDGTLVTTTTETGLNDTGLTAATTYSYAVSAFDPSNNESAPCTAVAARTLDPGVTTHTERLEGTADIDDAFIAANEPNTNRGGDGYVGTIDRFVIRYNLPAAASGRRIVSATAHFYVWNQTSYQAGQYLDLHRLTSTWTESAVTWNNAASGAPWTTAGGDRAELVGRILHQAGSANWDHVYYPAVDLTLLVQKWAAGTVPNFGLVVDGSPVTGIGLKAAEYNPGPYLEIVYTDEAAPNLYEMWMHGHFTNGQLADAAQETTNWGRNADPDGDGLSNLFEYALGTDPNNAGSALGGVLRCESGAGSVVDLSFSRLARTSGVTFSLERSVDLATWETVSAADRTEAVADAGGGLEEVVWQLQPAAGTTRAFYRLRLDQQ
jgi:fibronectin type 3 domain-containing protein